MKYQKIPQEVEAIQVTVLIKLSKRQWSQLPEWVQDAYESGNLIICPEYIQIKSMMDNTWANGTSTEFLIREPDGYMYIRGEKRFKELFELVPSQ